MTDAASLPPYWRRLLSAILGAQAGAALGSVGVAALASFSGAPLFASWGLLLPISMTVALLFGAVVSGLHPGAPLPPLAEALRAKKTRFRILLLSVTLVALWVLVGQLTVRLLGAFSERSQVGGVVIAAAALGLLFMGASTVELISKKLAEKVKPPSALTTVGLSVLLVVVAVVTLVAVGTPSGTGSSLALFGVFKRPELNLSPVLDLVVLAGGAYAGAWGAIRLGLGALTGAATVCLALIGVAYGQASSMGFREAVAVQRSGSIVSWGLRLARATSDADGDGSASSFGGGDCDDSNAKVHPGALDVPENGIDEDCRGGDRAKPKTPQKEAPLVEKIAQLPQDANLLLLTIDTLRWDLGYTRKKPGRLSPHLDQLAARSTTYDNAYSLASYTSKSLGPMMIGRYPSETARTFEHFDRFSKNVPLIQERLQKAGVHTTSVQGYWYFFFKGYGFERGWDVLDSSSAPKLVAIEGDKTSNGDQLADKTIENLQKLKGNEEPFFLWTHWVDPHAEYVPHEEFDFGSESRERYDGEVAFVDAQIGRILDSLESLGLDEKTIVIVTSDHGEAFGEHGMIRHGFEVWEELVRVPLILHVPGAPARRVKQRRSFIDVVPTILETFELALPSGDEDFVRGLSLYRDALAAPEDELAERPVLVDMPQGPHNKERRAFYDGDLKLITSSGRVLGLYDLAQDPGEKKDLSDDTERVALMEEKMNAFLDELRPVKATR